ncbi:bifunctional precorrin-2 dehydrogenase/sirohydrochlorin ferrochelatase [Corallincola platygyrae]|uniref:precorrin-2 dehydrogenase n=1 Tax=Corallincola platygyrae TaxID=1193278 RepID=A0ABW4XKX3_9GAMM
MSYYPAFLKLSGIPVLVIGAGTVAERRVGPLLTAGANVTVVAPSHCGGMARYFDARSLSYQAKQFEPSDLEGHRLVIAATDNSQVNQSVAELCDTKGIFCNVVNDADRGSFICPAVITQGKFQVALASGGAAPVLTRWIKRRLQSVLPDKLNQLQEFSTAHRHHVKRTYSEPTQRRRFWERFFSVAIHSDPSTYSDTYQTLLKGAQPSVVTAQLTLPSENDDLTLRDLKLLHSADLVVGDLDDLKQVDELLRQDCLRQTSQVYLEKPANTLGMTLILKSTT